MKQRNLLRILWRRKWVIVAIAAMTIAVVVAGTLMMTPMYEATATLRIATAAAGSVSTADYQYADRLMNTYAEIATSRPVLEELMELVALPEPPEVKVEVVPDTELIRISVEAPSPSPAALMANALAEILVFRSGDLYTGGGRTAKDILSEQLYQVERELAEARAEQANVASQTPDNTERIAEASRAVALKEQTYAMLLGQYEEARIQEAIRANALSIVEPAVAIEAPSRPRWLLNIALGVAVGLAAGVGLAFLLENLDTTLRDAEQVEDVTSLPTLGRIPALESGEEDRYFGGTSPHAEAFRALWAALRFSCVSGSIRIIQVTSPMSLEGKSTVIANLAVAVARAGPRVVVVDGDLRRPRLHQLFDVDPPDATTRIGAWWGLTGSLLEGGVDGRLRPTDVSGLRVLPSGELPPNTAEIVGSPQMQRLLRGLTSVADIVLVDSPPVLAVADAAALAQVVDGVLLVLEAGHSQRQDAQRAVERLRQVGANLIGVVLNAAPMCEDSDYGYSYGETNGNGNGSRQHPRQRVRARRRRAN